ncbi:hypothetical protein [Dyella caseinilytica]|uniref:Minor structural protein GP20 n=1 Tax=Dyella caseinilytica TaxID=1849581 RepID=A0ABX7GQX6_9GAMM|nr:hypothetical protein [Dyella caseinilytica]QRN52398.1 hypothetical protein ISN74_13020 [Dyella caseinilytica]GGA05648.1 hypothetical protein GCM10011408_28210 [Dyella caseinilytica]
MAFDANDPKDQEVLAAAVAEAVEAATAGLKTKNTELLGKLQKAKGAQTIDPAEHAALEAERDNLAAQLADANKATAKATKDADTATKRLADLTAANDRAFTDAALTEALTRAGVTNPVHVKAAKAMHGGSLSVADENGVRTVKAGDKSLGDFVTEWAGSDEGKHFVTVANVSGGGAANAGAAGVGAKQPTLTEQALALKAQQQK